MSEFITEQEVREAIWTACKEAGTQKAFARKIGLSEVFLSRVLCGHKRPSPRIISPLGIERANPRPAPADQPILYVKKKG